MPTRPREHQIEGISIRFFESLLPPQWVCRRKESDYGVDLEVEVFDKNGQSTSLTFIVQIKATDDPQKERSMSISLDRLSYLAGHDAPSMIARYCEPTKTLHFMWISNVFAQVGRPDTKTVTVKFSGSDIWEPVKAQEIFRSLKVYRRLRSRSGEVPFGLSIEADGLSVDEKFVLNHGLSQICDSTAAVVRSADVDNCVPVSIRVFDNILRVEVDVLASVSGRIDELTTPNVLPKLIYALAFLAGQFSFKSQFTELVRLIHERSFTTQSRLVSSAVAGLAMDKPDIAADLASWNELHTELDQHYWSYFASIMKAGMPKEETKLAAERFLSETMASNLHLPVEARSAFHRNLANFYMTAQEHLLAVRQFNVARKMAPIYLSRAYFLKEFAACLFLRRHYTKAAELYLVAFRLDGGSQVGICAGDALLYSGHFAVATDTYQRAIEYAVLEKKTFDELEATLKSWLSDWVKEHYGFNQWTGKDCLSDRAIWMDVIDRSLDETCFESALAAALMEGFLADGDEGLWADAIAFAFNTKNDQLMIATLSCAIWRFGYDVYALFRGAMKDNGFPSIAIERMDEIADSLVDQKKNHELKGFTMRFMNTEDTKASFEIVF